MVTAENGSPGESEQSVTGDISEISEKAGAAGKAETAEKTAASESTEAAAPMAAGLSPRAAVRCMTARLADAGCDDAAFDARELFRLATGRDARLTERALSADEAARLETLCARRAAREPLQYLCGRWPFLGFELEVGPGVLCPRADTEVVAEAAAQTVCAQQAPEVLDLCAGSGCLGLGVKMFCPGAHVTALEKSGDAFRYLKRNAAHALDGLRPAAQESVFQDDAPFAPEDTETDAAEAVSFDWGGALNALKASAGGAKPRFAYAEPVQGDIFAYYQELRDESFDLIVSNPPYLTAAEMTELQPEVAHEPAMALAAGEDGLVFYRLIAEYYKRPLKKGGALVLEIGWHQAAQVAAILRSSGWTDVEVRRDYGGNDRCVLAHRSADRRGADRRGADDGADDGVRTGAQTAGAQAKPLQGAEPSAQTAEK